MAQEPSAERSTGAARRRLRIPPGLLKFARYAVVRGVALIITVSIGVYLAILIANMGGYVDEIRIAGIQNDVTMSMIAVAQQGGLTPDELRVRIDDEIEREIRQLGLDKPFITRSFGYLLDALTLSLGRAERISSNSGSRIVRLIITERLPSSVMLFTTASLLVFIVSVFYALFLSRRYGSLLDRLAVAMAPVSAAPPWFYGVFLILIFASLAGILPYGNMVDAPPPETSLGYALSVMKHMILPLLAWFLSGAWIAIYTWRTFFLIHSSEDYVELAKAKGLRSRTIERRYVLRPTLPTVVTAFALILIASWQGAIITETVFSWPGLGSLYMQAISAFDTPVIIGLTVVYAYLLAITVFTLDIVYALIDPRVKLGAEGSS